MQSGGWRTLGAVEQYMKTVEVVAPGRKEILSIIARLAVNSATEQPKILDIGCGMGIVTDEILKYTPHASVVMMDFSEEMISICNERFKDRPNIQVFHQDLNKGLGPSPGSIWDMYNDLKSAGFEYIDCLCKYQNLGVIAAINK